MNIPLALQVKAYILAHPQELYMGQWYAPADKLREDMDKYSIEGSERLKNLTRCGSAGCIAGTACMLSGKIEGSYCFEGYRTGGQNALELDYNEALKLFHFHTETYRNPYNDLRVKIMGLLPGTIEYAQVVAEAIDRCIERNP